MKLNICLKRIFLLTIIVIITTTPINVKAITEDEVRRDLEEAFESLVKAETAGGEVHSFTVTLNEAANLINGATEEQLATAEALIQSVQSQVVIIELQARTHYTNRLITTGAILLVIGLLIGITWIYGSKIFWKIWLRGHREWTVEKI